MFGETDVTSQNQEMLNYYYQRAAEQYGKDYEPEDVSGGVYYCLDTETIFLQITNIEFKLSESKKEDNTDYFCGLFMNSSSNEKYTQSDGYTWEQNENLLQMNGNIKQTEVYKYPEINNKNSSTKGLSNFPKFDKNGNIMYYIQNSTNDDNTEDEYTNIVISPYTNVVISPYIFWYSDGTKDLWLTLSDGAFDETINVIWKKMYGDPEEENEEENAEPSFKEFDIDEIEDTCVLIKEYIRSWEGTYPLYPTDEEGDEGIFHFVYYDTLGIPTTAWGINLFWYYTEFEPYLGNIVYTPAFFLGFDPATENALDVGAFYIDNNTIEKVFDKIVKGHRDRTQKMVQAGVFNLRDENGNVIDTVNKENYISTPFEADALTRVKWGWGNYGRNVDYIRTVEAAYQLSLGVEENGKRRSSFLDRSVMSAMFVYYEQVKDNLMTLNGQKYFKIRDHTDEADVIDGDIGSCVFLLYTSGLYYRRYGELIGAEGEENKHGSYAIKMALEKYQELVDYGFKYDDGKGVIFYEQDKNGNIYKKADTYYALSQNDPEKYPLTINDFEYVSWVYNDLGYLENVYTNYESFIKGILYRVLGYTNTKNTTETNSEKKIYAVNNTGKKVSITNDGMIEYSGNFDKTITSYDDLLPGDIVIVQQGDTVTAKIYAGRYNWIEMNKETLEDLEDDGMREIDEYNSLYKAPIANYKGRNLNKDDNYKCYGDRIDVANDVLWVIRVEDIATNYVFNDSFEFTKWEINDLKLKRESRTTEWINEKN